MLKWAARRSASSAPRIGNPWFAGASIWQNWNTKKAINEGYKAHYALYTVASDLAGCVRQVPWQLKRKTDDGADIVDGHPLIETIRYPNSSQTWGSLMEAWDLYKSLSGNAYARFTQIGDSLKLWYLRPDRIEIIPGKRGEIESYKYTVGQHEEFYKPQEIVHFKFFDPGDDYYGLAPLQAAARIVDASNATITWNGNLVGNRARPSGMMSSKTPLTPDQHKHWREALKEQVSGEKNAGKMLINPVDATFEAFELTPLELDYLASLGTYEAAVCKVFHVHPEAIGALNATFENKAWAIRDKWEGPVQNRLNEMRATLNHAFYPLFGTADPKTAAPGELFLDYDMSGTPGANAAQGEALERATKAWACGVPWDVADEKFGVGIGPIPGGDKGYIPVNLYEVGTTVDQGRSSRTVDRGGAEWRAIEQRKQGWEKSVAGKVRGVLAEECDLIVKAVKAGTIDTDPIIDAHRGAWEKLLTAVFRAVIEDFGGEVAKELSGGRTEPGPDVLRAIEALSGHRPETRDDFDPWSEAVQDWVTTQTAEDITLITATTKKAVRKVILDTMNEGESMVTAARRIREEMEGESRYRSMLISRTEVHRAAGYGMNESARQSGVAQEKHWLDAGDDRVRESHAANTAEGWIPFDQAYSNGAMYPGDGTDDVQCRCTEMYRAG